MTKRTPPYSPEVRERAVRMVLDHQGEHGSQYAAIQSIAAKIGCSGETLRNWVRQAERDRGLRAGPSTQERERIKALERENRELRQANEILRKASAYFAMAELDRPQEDACALEGAAWRLAFASSSAARAEPIERFRRALPFPRAGRGRATSPDESATCAGR